MYARRVLLLVIVVATRGLLVRVIKLRGRLHHGGLTRPYAHTCRGQRGQVLDELAFDLSPWRGLVNTGSSRDRAR
jgi:hypothetical protein